MEVTSVLYNILLPVLIIAIYMLNRQVQSSAEVTGRIIDEETGEPLESVKIQILGASASTISDKDGKYSLKEISQGRFNLVLTYNGYSKRIITGLQIRAGQTINFNLSLSAENFAGETISDSATVLMTTYNPKLTVVSKSLTLRKSFPFGPIAGFHQNLKLNGRRKIRLNTALTHL